MQLKIAAFCFAFVIGISQALDCYNGAKYVNFVDSTGNQMSATMPTTTESNCSQCSVAKVSTEKSGWYVAFQCVKVTGPSGCAATTMSTTSDYNTTKAVDKATTTTCICCTNLCNGENASCLNTNADANKKSGAEPIVSFANIFWLSMASLALKFTF